MLQKKYDWTKQYVEEMITETELSLKFEERRDVLFYKMSKHERKIAIKKLMLLEGQNRKLEMLKNKHKGVDEIMTGVKKGWLEQVKSVVDNKGNRRFMLKHNKELSSVPDFVKLNSSRDKLDDNSDDKGLDM